MVANLPCGPTPTSYQPSEALTLAFEHEELEVRSVVGKRRMGQGYDYRVRWKDTWLPKSELGNIQRSIREARTKAAAALANKDWDAEGKERAREAEQRVQAAAAAGAGAGSSH